jgi:hypothetical protein
MLVMISLATNEMIGLVAMYPDMWFMDTYAGWYDAFVLYEFMYSINSFVICIHVSFEFIVG